MINRKRHSKNFFIAFALLAAACGGESSGSSQPVSPTADTASTASAAPSAELAPSASSAPATHPPKSGTLGGMCGGIAALPCASGLQCVMSGPAHPDQSGICQKP